MRGQPRKVKELLQKARESALLAVEVYNRPTAVFRSGAYIVLMTIAWTALLQAIFHKKRISYYEKRKGRYVLIDGEKKAWDADRCVSEYFKNPNEAARKNLEFIIAIRNKIEHRSFPELDNEIFGECQALLLNFEETLDKEFPKEPQINQNLIFALQFSRVLEPTQQNVLSSKISRDLTSIKKYIEQFRIDLTEDQWNSQKFSFRLSLIPKVGNNTRKNDVAVEYIRYDPAKPEEMARIQQIGVLIKEKIVEKEKIVASQDVYKLKPGDVIKAVSDVIKRPFNMTMHTNAWHHYKVRPRKSSNQDACEKKYCTFDTAHQDYVYSENWVRFLIGELTDQTKYELIKNLHKSRK